jgi:tRNA dimethylallyltransferase
MQRMDEMLAHRDCLKKQNSCILLRDKNALQTVGYQEIFDFMDGKYDREEAIRLLKRNSRRYAKRQLTWFKRDEEIKWFNPLNLQAILEYIN